MTNMKIYWQSNALNHNISFLFCRKLWQVEYTYGYLHLLFTFFKAHSLSTVCLSKWKDRSIYRFITFFCVFDSWTLHIKQQEHSLYKDKKLFSTDISVSCIYRNLTDMSGRWTVLFWKRFDDWIITFCPIIYYMAKRTVLINYDVSDGECKPFKLGEER